MFLKKFIKDGLNYSDYQKSQESYHMKGLENYCEEIDKYVRDHDKEIPLKIKIAIADVFKYGKKHYSNVGVAKKFKII